MKKETAPLFEKVRSHIAQNKTSFHIPGHKSGSVADPETQYFFREMIRFDITEITGLDDLHQPQGAILEAQRLAAQCFGAEETFFLVNGSTIGILAMILCTCRRGDVIIVQRNVHKSVIHGLMLAGAQAVFLQLQWDEKLGLYTGVRTEDVNRALQQYPEAKAVFITNPNYYGFGISVADIAETAHAHGKPLLVDEAHGAHFGFHPMVPKSALSCGADLVVQSTHKMLTALTMGAMLHAQGQRIDRYRLRQLLGMLQSSSPSYPVMVSLDLCRKWMDTQGKESLAAGLKVIDHFIERIREISAFQTVDYRIPGPSYAAKDPFKILLRDGSGTLSGFELQQQLEEYGCMMEMADSHNVVAVFSLTSTCHDAERLLNALELVCRRNRLKEKELSPMIANTYNIPSSFECSCPVAFDMGDRGSGSVRRVELAEAENQRSAEMVIPYPPGIPVLYPGEWIHSGTIAYLRKLAQSGARFQGAKDVNLQTIEIFEE